MPIESYFLFFSHICTLWWFSALGHSTKFIHGVNLSLQAHNASLSTINVSELQKFSEATNSPGPAEEGCNRTEGLQIKKV